MFTELDSVGMWQFEAFSRFRRVRHGVTTRRGGVSEGAYAQLNLGLHVGDDPERVVENRQRACRALGIEFGGCTFAQQVHGEAIRLVSPEEAGAGRARFEDGLPDTDGLVVRDAGVAAAVLVADCVPLVLYDPENHVGAVVHAGWRGTAAGIAAKSVGFLAEECGSRPAALAAGVGPAIGGCCYEVSAEVAERVRGGFRYEERVVEKRAGTWYVDLAKANQQQLRGAGVRPESIELSGICTSCRADEFYSERKLGRPTGRFGAFLSLE